MLPMQTKRMLAFFLTHHRAVFGFAVACVPRSIRG